MRAQVKKGTLVVLCLWSPIQNASKKTLWNARVCLSDRHVLCTPPAHSNPELIRKTGRNACPFPLVLIPFKQINILLHKRNTRVAYNDNRFIRQARPHTMYTHYKKKPAEGRLLRRLGKHESIWLVSKFRKCCFWFVDCVCVRKLKVSNMFG